MGQRTCLGFHFNRRTTVTGPILQAFVSAIFPNPSGFDYAAGQSGAAQFDYWTSFDFAVSNGVIANLSFGGCDHFVCELSPTNPPNHWTNFGLNEPGPGFNVPTFCLEGKNGYQWFGGPAPVANNWYHIDLHVVYDNATQTFSPELFIDGVNMLVPTGHSYAPAFAPGDQFFYYGTDQFCGGHASPSSSELTWLRNITVGTVEGASDVADLTTAAELTTAILNGSGDNPAASLSVLTTAPF